MRPPGHLLVLKIPRIPLLLGFPLQTSPNVLYIDDIAFEEAVRHLFCTDFRILGLTVTALNIFCVFLHYFKSQVTVASRTLENE